MNTLHVKLEIDVQGVRAELRSDLKRFVEECQRALRLLEAGERLPAHLIANATMVTAEIERWNLLREVMAYLNVHT